MLKYLTIILFLLLLTSCGQKKTDSFQLNGRTMGTRYHITISKQSSSTIHSSAQLQKEIDKRLEKINQQMSTYRNDSEISLFNQSHNKNWFPVSKELLFVVKVAQSISQSTSGAFDITVAPLVNLWGFGKNIQYQVPTDKQIDATRKIIGYQLLEIQESPPALRKRINQLKIDLSAIAKGYAVDDLSQYLVAQGYQHFMVEIGGEIKVKGNSPAVKKWHIKIQSPNLNSRSNKSKTLIISDQAIATSGNYLNYYTKDSKRYSHIIDPRSAQPEARQPSSITVLHSSAMLADGYATAFMVLGKKEGEKLAKKLRLTTYWVLDTHKQTND